MADAGNTSYGIWPQGSGAIPVSDTAGYTSLLWPPHSGAVGVPVQAGCKSFLLWPFGLGCVPVAPPPEPETPSTPPAPASFASGGYPDWSYRTFADERFDRLEQQLHEDDLAVLVAVMQFVLEEDTWELSPIA